MKLPVILNLAAFNEINKLISINYIIKYIKKLNTHILFTSKVISFVLLYSFGSQLNLLSLQVFLYYEF
jgi:hypothetical protein